MSKQARPEVESAHIAKGNLQKEPHCFPVLFGDGGEHGEKQHDEVERIEHGEEVRQKIYGMQVGALSM